MFDCELKKIPINLMHKDCMGLPQLELACCCSAGMTHVNRGARCETALAPPNSYRSSGGHSEGQPGPAHPCSATLPLAFVKPHPYFTANY